MYEDLFTAIESVGPVSEGLKERLCLYLQKKEYKKKSCLLREGQIANYIYFINTGLVKCYYIKEGVEICSWFMRESNFIVAVKSFFTRKESYEYIETIEDSTVSYLHYNNLQSLYKEFPEFNLIGRLITEKYYVLAEERLHGMRKMNAEQRFEALQQSQPDILPRVSRKDIASYLGITLETLSRITARKYK